MPRISDIAVYQQLEQSALCISAVTKVQDLPALIGQSYAKLAKHLEALEALMADVPFVAFHNMDMQRLEVEIGFVVPASLPGKDDIQPGRIAACKAAVCMYRGPYCEVEPVYHEMARWIGQHGYQPAGTSYEYYYNGPDVPESDLLTKIVLPLK